MGTYKAQQTTIDLSKFFNPYAGMGPPDCCYCAPTGVPINIMNVSSVVNEAQQAAQQAEIQVQVNAYISNTVPGLSSLAFMTKAEDSMRTIERGRIEKRLRGLRFAQGTAEMGHGPFFYPKDPEEKYIP